jgi:hypothetical protein
MLIGSICGVPEFGASGVLYSCFSSSGILRCKSVISIARISRFRSGTKPEAILGMNLADHAVYGISCQSVWAVRARSSFKIEALEARTGTDQIDARVAILCNYRKIYHLDTSYSAIV